MAALSEVPCKRQQSRCGRCLTLKDPHKKRSFEKSWTSNHGYFQWWTRNETINLGTIYLTSQKWKRHFQGWEIWVEQSALSMLFWSEDQNLHAPRIFKLMENLTFKTCCVFDACNSLQYYRKHWFDQFSIKKWTCDSGIFRSLSLKNPPVLHWTLQLFASANTSATQTNDASTAGLHGTRLLTTHAFSAMRAGLVPMRRGQSSKQNY